MAHKICPSCGSNCPIRIRKCKSCGCTFSFKPRKNKKKTSFVKNWKDLSVGDYIKSSGGPVWIDKDGNEMSMGYSGTYSVLGLDENGILAQGRDKTSGFCHIWMAKEFVNCFGIHKRPHKIFKLNLDNKLN